MQHRSTLLLRRARRLQPRCRPTSTYVSPTVAAELSLKLREHVDAYSPPELAGCTWKSVYGPSTVDVQPSSTGVECRVSVPTFSPACSSSHRHASAVSRIVSQHASAALSLPASSTLTWRPHPHARRDMSGLGACLSHIGSIIAVSSGKGGVGKSHVAVNLAYALSACGARVGLFDADIHGPSLPVLVTPDDVRVVKSAAGTVNAVTHRGVRMQSYGWVAPRTPSGERHGAVMRGPMLSSVLTQLLKFTEWGVLDHLIIDMPPGTGDVHITLSQIVPISAAVIVTTAAKVSLADVAKGLAMFKSMKVPPAALVVNMSHFDADGVRHYPFGRPNPAALESLVAAHSIPAVYHFPILPALADAGEAGVPFMLSAPPGDAVAEQFKALAATVADACEERVLPSMLPGASDVSAVQLRFDDKRGVVVLRLYEEAGAREELLPPRALRLACACAACVDEHTGRMRVVESSIPADVRPLSVTAQGNYAHAVRWSDGHSSSIYTHAQLRKLVDAAARVKQQQE